MFTIYDGRETFYQWDLDRKLIVNDNTIKEVHFANCLCSDARKCETYTEGGLNVVDVPNELLTEYLDINVYAYDSGMTKHSATFGVVKRTKPADYIYTPTELKKWEELEKNIEEVEQDITEVATKAAEDTKALADVSSQGRNASYSITTGGWKRILNVIRGTSGTVNMCLGCNYPYRSMQQLAFDFGGYVKYPRQNDGTAGDNKGTQPKLIKKYENIFGVYGTHDNPQAKITKVRIAYPASGTAPQGDGTNPINCYVDIYVDIDTSKIIEGRALPEINMNFSGFANSHNCEAIKEETSAADTGIYGEALQYYEKNVADMERYVTNTSEFFKYNKSYATSDTTYNGDAIIERFGTTQVAYNSGKSYVEVTNPAPYSNLKIDFTGNDWYPYMDDMKIWLHSQENLIKANNEACVAGETIVTKGLTFKRAPNSECYYVDGTSTKAGIYNYGDVTLKGGEKYQETYLFRVYKPENSALSKGFYYQLYEVNEDGTLGEQLTRYMGYDKDSYYIYVDANTTKTVRVRFYWDAGITINNELCRVYIDGGYPHTVRMIDYKYNNAPINTLYDLDKVYVYTTPYTPNSFKVHYNKSVMTIVEELKNAIISLGGNV